MSTVEAREGSQITDWPGFSVEYRDASHRYWLIQDGERTPAVSVTSALKVIDKPSLIPWAERMGVEGALTLERDGVLQGIAVGDALGVVRREGAGADAKRDAGADRGTAIHDALQLYCEHGTVPSVGDFDPQVQGYVAGLCKWLLVASPEPILTEAVIGSPTHGFAGRFDLLANVDGLRTLCDLKTSARVYPEHHLQMSAYCLALEECGQEPAFRSMVVAVAEDGSYTTAEGCAEPGDFLAVLGAHRALSRVRSAVRAQEKRQEATA